MAEWNKKRDTVRHYDQLARVYDTQYADEQKAKIEATLESVSPSKDNSVLDVGCGIGLLFPYIANRVRFLVGIDISQRLLKKAKTNSKSHPNTHVLLADADHLPFPNQTFHTTFAITLLQNTPKPLTTLQEIKRVSKNYSTIAVTGLMKEFTADTFVKLLQDAKLKVQKLKTNNNCRDYIAICSQSP